MKCRNCEADVNSIVIHKDDLWCWPCHNATKDPVSPAPMIATDTLPGGYWVRHGLCHEDGSPRRFDSKSDIKKAAFEKNLTILGETPKPNPRIVDAEHDKARSRRSG